MAELPASVRVGPFSYSITVDTPRLAREHPNWCGMTQRSTLEIVLLAELAPARMREVLWHEVKHAVADVVGWETDDRWDEEAAINRMAPLELAVLRDNPALVAYLLELD